MTGLLWFAIGGAVGWLTIYLHVWSAARVGPHSPPWYAGALVAGAYLRWMLVAILFVLALQQSVTATLLAFVGLWLMRWWLLFRLNAGMAFGKLLGRG